MLTKKRTLFQKLSTAMIFSLLTALLVLTAMPVSVQAASAKKVNAVTNYKKAPALKVGMNKVTAKKNDSYVKFTAKKTGTYTFTISNIATIKPNDPDMNLGNLYIKKMQYNYLSSQKVKTNGGSNSCLFTATKYSYEHYHKTKKPKTSSYLATRYGKIKLNAGETVYLQYYYTGKKCTYNLKVS